MSGALPISVHGAGGPAGAAEPALPAFYLDLASPECYLACERILPLMPVAVEWIPIHLQPAPPSDEDREWIARTALERNLQKVRWPPPFDAEFANLTATYAKSIGRVVAFTQAAIRQAYAGGRDLSLQDNVLIAASACEMHPAAILKTVPSRAPRRTLEQATQTARERGVASTPAVWIPDPGGAATAGRVLHGDSRLEDAAALLAEHAP
jgi:2-hydroxychromene-2-carboxylate isomerase